MTYISFSFLLFFIVVSTIYFCTPSKYQYIVLLAASYLFYFFASEQLPVYMMITSVIIYAGTNMISKIDSKTISAVSTTHDLTREQKKILTAGGKKKKKTVLVFIILLNLGVLTVFKYTNPLMSGLSGFMQSIGFSGFSQEFRLVLPLGISFYTFQSLGYSIDVFRGTAKAEKNILKTALFISYFPQIVQGPIGRFGQLAPQLFAPHRFSFERLKRNLFLILWGFIKKMVIADSLALMGNEMFTNYSSYDGFQLFLGIMVYAIQLYTDFSGCMDIAMGFSGTLGIQLAYNFRQPYFSQSVAEFWRRWHISLCMWFRDYLFYPIIMSKRMKNIEKRLKARKHATAAVNIPTFIGMIVVWSLTGLWHAAGWPYILWGILNGVIMICGIQFRKAYSLINTRLHIKEDSWWWKGFRIVRTFMIMALLNFICGFDKMGDVAACLMRVLKNPFPRSVSASYIFPVLIDKSIYFIVALFMICMSLLLYSIYEETKGSVVEKISGKNWTFQGAVLLALSFSVIFFSEVSTDLSGGFMYAQF